LKTTDILATMHTNTNKMAKCRCEDNDNALVALALMTAKNLPEQKDIVIALVVNMLVEGA